MNPLFCPFLSSTLPHPKPLVSPSLTTTRPSSSPYPPLLHISAIRNVEDKLHSTFYATPTTSQFPEIPTTVITAKKRPVPSLLVTIFNALDDFINNFIGPPLPPSIDPKHVLSGNFAPVDELPPTECEVIEGSLPPCLDGAYIRNGPNPQFYPRGPHHLFDGDGMLHSIRISHGRPIFCSRYVKTYKYIIEKRAGSPVIPNLFSSYRSFARSAVAIARLLTGQFDPVNGVGLANTSVAFFCGHLYALAESDLPYAVRLTPDGDIKTLGRYDFDGKLSMSMTAHPKIDPSTGEAFAFRYSPVRPFLTYFRFDAQGKKQPDVPIFSLSCPSFFHDFAITNRYAIFPDIQMWMNPVKMIIRGGSPVGTDPTKVPRVGIIPRYAKDESEMRWIDVPGFNIIHAINAWDEEDGDAIVMVAPNILPIEHALERMDLVHGSLEKVRIDLKTGTVTRHRLSQWNLEFAVINPGYLGKKNRYVYSAVGDPLPKISGIVKLDVSRSDRRQECIVAKRMYEPGCYGGEPFFVAKEPDNPEAEEDDGYVLSYVHDEQSGKSRFIVMDAQSPDLDIVAAVKLPTRVPYGFHGLFVKGCDLKMD
uniref:Carotenoid cleavage dioxygenase 4b n=1 Tax=Vitis vinifera TaxID=29760 RepID=U3M7R9_VITVI|nr:carotenoid cleavage dioxygenase 4b [Vitis vinifera]